MIVSARMPSGGFTPKNGHLFLLHFIFIVQNGLPKPVAEPKRHPFRPLVFSSPDFHGTDDGTMAHVAAKIGQRQAEPLRQFR